MHRACWLFVVGVLACGAASRMDRHLEAAVGPSLQLQTAGARTLDRLGRQDGGRRLALVVGNDAYPDSPLRNAVNDARAVAAALAEVGFAVTRVENASRARMAGAIGTFAADLSEDDTALFYFAGHGVQVGQSPENYLIPTDFDGRTESAVRLNALKAADVVGELQRARVAMAVFDACRNNPYRGRRGPTGLAAMEARGTLIAYAADAGQTASDNPAGQNGLFTQHFVAALREPGLTATALFQQVRRDVVAASRERQWPAVYDSLLADFVFRSSVVTDPDPVVTDPDPVVTATELEYWRSVQAMNTAAAYRSYERQYPNGRFAELSRLRRSDLGDVASGGPVVGAGDLSSRRRPGEVFRDCPFCPEMVVIPAGTFQMGSPASEEGRGGDEGPRHRVTLGSFALGRYEVTREEYAAFASATGRSQGGCFLWDRSMWNEDADASWSAPGFAQGDRHPVVCVSWDDAQAYVRWLSRETGEGYRLPSESEWEYAARGYDRSSSQCGYANGADASAKRVYSDWMGATSCDDGSVHTALVGSYDANAFGLFDMLGNVYEWTADCWHGTYAGAPDDGSVWTRGGDCRRRVLRGGSWRSIPRTVRVANRDWIPNRSRLNIAGFRVSRTFD